MGQESYLKGRSLVKRSYVPLSETSDHEHCRFCWEKFGEHEGNLRDGYVAVDDPHIWVCPECFEDFKELFDWMLTE